MEKGGKQEIEEKAPIHISYGMKYSGGRVRATLTSRDLFFLLDWSIY